MPWRIFAKAACPMVVCLLVIEVVQMNFSGLGSRKLSQFPLLVFLTSKALFLSFNFQNHIHSNLEWIGFCFCFRLDLTSFENCVTFCLLLLPLFKMSLNGYLLKFSIQSLNFQNLIYSNLEWKRFFVWVSCRLKIACLLSVCCRPCLKWAKMVISLSVGSLGLRSFSLASGTCSRGVVVSWGPPH